MTNGEEGFSQLTRRPFQTVNELKSWNKKNRGKGTYPFYTMSEEKKRI